MPLIRMPKNRSCPCNLPPSCLLNERRPGGFSNDNGNPVSVNGFLG